MIAQFCLIFCKATRLEFVFEGGVERERKRERERQREKVTPEYLAPGNAMWGLKGGCR